ncbi:MAG TPA: sporulation protein YqfD [Symbiobacteriaceae bacterium]|nr:sporulation protein YqfD [Symbiobacteriaceae bacterium]
MLRRLVAFLLGHLRIEVTGGRVERFLNLVLERDLTLWNIERTRDSMRASIPLRDFWELRPVARGSRCRVRILRRRGFPFLASRLRRRPALLAGALVCLAFIVWATGHVWIVKVKVTGPQNLDPRAVAAVAAEAGLRPGAWKSGVELRQVEAHLQKRMGEISVAVIRVQGTRAVIEVVEKVAQRRDGNAGCINLVARRPGVIEEIVPFWGEPQVKKGDIVKAGDMLVECAFKYWEGGRPQVLPGTEKPPRTSVARVAVAQAIVRARVSYSMYQEIPVMQTRQVETGRQQQRWVLKYGDQSIILRGAEEPSFARYQEQRKAYGLPGWRNWKLPVELVMVTYNEVEVRREPITRDEAVKQATGKLTDQLRWTLGPGDEVLRPVSAEVIDQGSDFLGIRVTAETLEEIAQPREGQPLPLPEPPKKSATNP